MMKRLFLSVTFLAIAAGVFAQAMDEGVKYLYYNQFKKAKDYFNKILAANPADPDANYWLGQTYIYDDDLPAAKAHYAKAMTATSQNPLIMVGMGHVEVLEKKNQEARAHFDQAIELTKNKKNKNFGDPRILAGIGRANADGGAEIGDPVYGIDKLQQAAQLEPKNPELMLNIGLSQLKRGGEFGGEAKKAFDGALERDPTYARSFWRIGKIFESQRNTAVFLENYEKAIETDPKYAPAYLSLYTYYSDRDVNKAKELLDKYIANTEQNRETDFFYADYLFRAGKYQESLDAAKKIEASLNGEPFAKIHKLFAYDYDRLGDSLTATKEMETYIAKENPAKLSGEDYAAMAGLYAKDSTQTAKADEFYSKAVDADTAIANKLIIINQAASVFSKYKRYDLQYAWMSKVPALKPELSATDYYYLGDAAEKAGKYDSAMAIYKRYYTKFPEQPQGYAGQLRSAIKADPDTSKGIALPPIEEYNAFLMKDTAKNKNRIITNIGYKVYYYVNKAKDYEKAIAALDEILALDPENTYAKSGKEQLLKILNKKNAAPKSGGSGQSSPAAAAGSKNGKPPAK
jgi:tetratricopeptide (TPR) repeat protein